MAITIKTFKSFGHALATYFKGVVKVGVKDINYVEDHKAVIEGTSAAVLAVVAPAYGPLVLTVEDASLALLGEVAAALTAGNDAVEQHLLNAGLDQKVIDTVKAVAKDTKQISTLFSVPTK